MTARCVGLSGRIGSGKSSVAAELARLLDCQVVSFGAYVRAEAERRGMSSDRDSLQRLGRELVERRGYPAFVGDVLADASVDAAADKFVVEGIRHLQVADALRAVVGGDGLLLVHVEAADDERQRRVAARDGEAASLERWEQHETESDVKRALPERADMLVIAIDAATAATEIQSFLLAAHP